MAGHSHKSDQDYAFELQLQEALTASLAHHTSFHSPPTTSTVGSPPLKDTVFTLSAQHVSNSQQEALDHERLLIETQRTKEELKLRIHDEKLAGDINGMPEHGWEEWGSDFERHFGEGSWKDLDSEDTVFILSAQHVSNSQQEALDHERLLIETQWTKEDLKRRIHDEKLAGDIDGMPEHGWEEWGSDFERDFGEGSWKDLDSEDDDEFRMYFKGILSHEVINNETVALAGIGVAICDFWDNLIFEIKKPLTGDGLNKQAAEIMALIEGLDAALSLELKRIRFFCDYYPVFQFVTSRWQARQHKIAILVDKVWLLQRRFVCCEPILVPRYEIKYAFKLARDAILSQVNRPIEFNRGKSVQETCVICLEDTDMERMFSVDGCLHRYCFSCIKQHVEVKLLHGMVPKCPHEGCKSELRVESCKNFLTPMMIETLKERIKEASIPATEKVYCPYPQCSALMSRSEILEYPKNVFVGYERSAARKCIKCHGLFCINCKVPWHGAMSCNEYKRLNPNPPAEDLKLKSLATRNMWRQCAKCNNMIEHSEGCWHMTCVCGYEFCYNCGAERKDKKATCSCPAWDVRRIWFENHRDSDGDDDDD